MILKKRRILQSVCILILISFVTTLCFKQLNDKQNLIKDGSIVSLEFKEQLEGITDGIYYFGRPDCFDCQMFQKPLEECLSKYDLNVYYVNTQFFKNSYSTFNDFLTQYNITSVPLLIRFKNQKEILRCEDIEEIELFMQEVLK